MGICLTQEETESLIESKAIDKDLKETDKKLKNNKEVKILLLGAGESGKSTILKQMKICFMNGFTENELKSIRPVIRRNVVDSISGVAEALKRFGIPYSNAEVQDFALKFCSESMESLPTIDYSMTKEQINGIKLFWADSAVKAALKRRNEFQFNDSAPYYVDNIERIADSNYVPTVQDVLLSRVKTTGITETRFKKDNMQICVYDVGGQRSERKKWVHYFEGITTVIFVASIADYDQVLSEDSQQNRMEESLVLFQAISNSPFFRKSSMILFLNKCDLLKVKIFVSPLKKMFPEYNGGTDYDQACDYILQQFLGCVSESNKAVYPHFTCAPDTDQTKKILTSVTDTLLVNGMKDIGLM